jgi:hypothetical protein
MRWLVAVVRDLFSMNLITRSVIDIKAVAIRESL